VSKVCAAVRAALENLDKCEATLDGSRIATHCLYPSFENVQIYIVKVGDAFTVHDDCGAFNSAWTHGRDELLIKRAISAEASRFKLKMSDNSLMLDNVSEDWLLSAILAVANASSLAANNAVSRLVAATEEALVDKIDRMLMKTVAQEKLAREITVTGKSGGKRHFDFAIRDSEGFAVLINGVAPHHSSINSKFVVFSDSEFEIERKLAVFDRSLETDDRALLQEVATIVPLNVLTDGTARALRFVAAH